MSMTTPIDTRPRALPEVDRFDAARPGSLILDAARRRAPHWHPAPHATAQWQHP
jgi:hypothetical protein